MSLDRGRRLPRVEGGAGVAPPSGGGRLELGRGRGLHASLFESIEHGRALLADAERRANETLRRAEREAAEVRLRAEAEARADATAALAARMLLLAQREADADERSLSRLIELATLLAERLLGETLALEPERVTALARQVLKEARGARRVTLVAHPEDAEALGRSLPDLGLSAEAVRLVADATQRRGDLRLETDVGVLDAEVAPQLIRLAAKLREAMGP